MMVRPKPPATFDSKGLQTGTADDAAVLLAASTLVIASSAGERMVPLDAAPVHDGLCAADGRIYVATRAGTVIAVE